MYMKLDMIEAPNAEFGICARLCISLTSCMKFESRSILLGKGSEVVWSIKERAGPYILGRGRAGGR